MREATIEERDAPRKIVMEQLGMTGPLSGQILELFPQVFFKQIHWHNARGYHRGNDGEWGRAGILMLDRLLDVQLGEGTLEIGRLSGKIEASVANGTLDFNSGALPKGACAEARATNGSIETPWGDSEGPGAEVAPCENPQVKLRIGNGSIIVR